MNESDLPYYLSREEYLALHLPPMKIRHRRIIVLSLFSRRDERDALGHP